MCLNPVTLPPGTLSNPVSGPCHIPCALRSTLYALIFLLIRCATSSAGPRSHIGPPSPQGAGEKQGDLPQPQPSSDKRQPPPVGAKQEIDFGPCPPNEKQLNSLAHVLAIMCLGLRLTVDSIETVAEVSEPCTKDNINLAFYPCEMGTGGEVIRSRTQEVLDDMKKGLYRTINPALAEHTIGARSELKIKN